MIDTALRPPANIEAEQALLGAILVNNAAFERVADFLKPEHFAEPIHGRIFHEAGRLISQGRTANPVSLKEFAERDAALADLPDEIRGHRYLARIAASIITAVNAEDYGRTVRDLWIRRQLLDAGQEIAVSAASPDLDCDAARLLENAEKRLFDLAEHGDTKGPALIESSVAKTLARIEDNWKNGRRAGVKTGIAELDRKISGLFPGKVYLIAGRPSMGKTALAGSIASNAARAEKAAAAEEGRAPRMVAFFSLEMPEEELTGRFLAQLTDIGTDRLDRAEIDANDFQRLVDAGADIAQWPIAIDDTENLSVLQIRQRARRLMRRRGLALIVIDYLQLMRAPKEAQGRGLTEEISKITPAVKGLAKELGVPVVLLSQMNRENEKRDDKRPQLSDLRQSGSIEQDADVVMFIHREQYYLERAEPVRRADETDEKFQNRSAVWLKAMDEHKDRADLIIAKQRGGQTGVARAHWNPIKQLVSNLAVWETK